MSNGDPKTLFGFVNVAHSDFGGNASYAVQWAQENGYQGAYIPPGIYDLLGGDGNPKPIQIETDNFALVGAGMDLSVLRFDGSAVYGYPHAITVESWVNGGRTVTGVRLADFTVQLGANPPAQNQPQGGVYLRQAV